MNLNINRDASASTYDTGIIHFADIAWMQHNVARCLLTCYNFIISIYNYYNLALKYNKQKKKEEEWMNANLTMNIPNITLTTQLPVYSMNCLIQMFKKY